MEQGGGLDDTDILASILPADAKIPDAHRAIIAAQANALLREKGAGAGEGGRSRLLVTLGRRLRKTCHADAYLALLDAVPSILAEDPPQALDRAIILNRLGEADPLHGALASDSLDLDISRLPRLLGLRHRHRIATDVALIERLFGRVRPSLPAMMRNFPVARWNTGEAEAMARALYALVQPADMGEGDYIERFIRGIGARLLYMSLGNRVEAPLKPLQRDVRRRVTGFDPAPVTAAAAAGRSIMGVTAHAGVASAQTRNLRELAPELPSLIVGNSPIYRDENTDSMGLAVRDLTTGDLLRTIRALRRKPYRIYLLPDGQAGGARRTVSVLGRDVSIAATAGVFAWQARADTFFLDTRWHGLGRIEVRLARGPQPGRAHDRADFIARFDAFYAARLERIVTGPPENIATTRGGIWHQLLWPQSETAPPADDDPY